MERDQLVIKQQNGNICNLQGQPDSFGTDKCPSPSPKSFPAAQLRQKEGGRAVRIPPSPAISLKTKPSSRFGLSGWLLQTNNQHLSLSKRELHTKVTETLRRSPTVPFHRVTLQSRAAPRDSILLNSICWYCANSICWEQIWIPMPATIYILKPATEQHSKGSSKASRVQSTACLNSHSQTPTQN